MSRMARVVCPEVPHHITQRGVRRFNVFLDESDHRRYLDLLKHYSKKFGLGITSYCVMTNHVHIVAVPKLEDSIAKVFRDCHGIYASEFNKKYRKTGHVWQIRNAKATFVLAPSREGRAGMMTLLRGSRRLLADN